MNRLFEIAGAFVASAHGWLAAGQFSQGVHSSKPDLAAAISDGGTRCNTDSCTRCPRA